MQAAGFTNVPSAVENENGKFGYRFRSIDTFHIRFLFSESEVCATAKKMSKQLAIATGVDYVTATCSGDPDITLFYQ